MAGIINAATGVVGGLAGAGTAAGIISGSLVNDETRKNNIIQVLAVGDNTGGTDGSDGNILQASGTALHLIEDVVTKTNFVTGATGASFLKEGRDVAYGRDTWVAVGDNVTGGGLSSGNILWSTDGISFRNVVATSEGFSVFGSAVTYFTSKNIWVAGGDSGLAATDAVDKLLYSTGNGSCWVTSSGASFNGSGGCNSLGSGPDYVLAVGDAAENSNKILSSTDGKTWTAVGPDVNGISFVGEPDSVLYNKGYWFVGGHNDAGSGSAASKLLRAKYTSDPSSLCWSVISETNLPRNTINDMAYGTGYLVAVGGQNTDGVSILAYSQQNGDAGTWTVGEDEAGSNLIDGKGIAFSEGFWVLVGRNDATGLPNGGGIGITAGRPIGFEVPSIGACFKVAGEKVAFKY